MLFQNNIVKKGIGLLNEKQTKDNSDMRITILLISLLLSISMLGQDMISRQAPKGKKTERPIEIKIESYSDVLEEKKTFKKGEPIILDKDDEWRWIITEEYENVNELYPVEISYRKYSSHPQYRVINSTDAFSERQINVYDTKGSLIRAGMIYTSSRYNELDENVRNELLKQLYIKDYNNNKHNFKKEDAKTQNYVKRELGIIPQVGSYNAWRSAFSPVGQRYLDQLELDHQNDLKNVLKIERLNNLSFKKTFGDRENNEESTYKVSYIAVSAYKQKITTSKLPLEKIDWSLYIEDEEENNLIESDELTLDNNFGDKTSILTTRYHKVKDNETIYNIAKKYGIAVDELCEINNILKSAKLRRGQILKVTVLENEPDENPSLIEKGEIESVDSDKVYDVVDEMPSFPGGNIAMWNNINSRLKYPVVAEENGIQGRVILTFVVDKDGSITDVKVVKSVDPSLDKEAVRIVESMPKWIPGRQKGVLVKTKYTIPVQFKLQ